MAENEEELLGGDYIDIVNQLNQQVTQMNGGFFQLSRRTSFEEMYPNAVNDFLQTDVVKSIAEEAGISALGVKPPINIPDETITKINTILESSDPLNSSDEDLTDLRSEVDAIVNDIDIPTSDELLAFINNYSKFVAAANTENISFPSNTREIRLVSTDISLDHFIFRTKIKKLIIIGLNKLVYPFITERYQIPSEIQATITGITGLKGDESIIYTDIEKRIGATTIKAGSKLLITNQAKKISNLEHQKVEIIWISEDSQTIQLKDPLLFDITDMHMLQIYEYTANNILSPGDLIKIPQ